jgi:CheY-like chemotaxis protein
MAMNSYKILIVDDVEVNLNILNKALMKYGFDTEIADRGKKALELIQSFKPDIVLLDINMPEMDGFTCCKKIKKINPEIYVIFVTALSDKNTRNTAFAVGGTDILIKPIDIKLLINKINGTLNITSHLEDNGHGLKKYEEKSS